MKTYSIFSKNPKLLSLAGSAAILGTVLTGGVVHAASNNGTDSGVTLAQTAQNDATGDHAARLEEYLSALAGRLNVTVDELKAAMKATAIERIDAKLAAGEITQEEAAAAKARVEAGNLGIHVGGGGRGHGHGGPGGGGIRIGADLATFLGIDGAALRTALESGQTLAQVAEANGKSRDELKAFLTSELKEKLDARVAAGSITQEDADARLAEETAGLDAKIDGTVTKGQHGERPAGGPARTRGAMPAGTTVN